VSFQGEQRNPPFPPLEYTTEFTINTLCSVYTRRSPPRSHRRDNRLV